MYPVSVDMPCSGALLIFVDVRIIVIAIWIVIASSFRVRTAYFLLGRELSFQRLERVSSIPAGGVVLTRYSLRWAFNASVVRNRAEQAHCGN